MQYYLFTFQIHMNVNSIEYGIYTKYIPCRIEFIENTIIFIITSFHLLFLFLKTKQ